MTQAAKILLVQRPNFYDKGTVEAPIVLYLFKGDYAPLDGFEKSKRGLKPSVKFTPRANDDLLK